jgi:hypothetical protein
MDFLLPWPSMPALSVQAQPGIRVAVTLEFDPNLYGLYQTIVLMGCGMIAGALMMMIRSLAACCGFSCCKRASGHDEHQNEAPSDIIFIANSKMHDEVQKFHSNDKCSGMARPRRLVACATCFPERRG